MKLCWKATGSGVMCEGSPYTVCDGNNEGVEQLIGNPNETLNSLSPSNRWADRKNKLGVGTVPEGLYRP